jgi:hypothetical protein
VLDEVFDIPLRHLLLNILQRAALQAKLGGVPWGSPGDKKYQT